MKSIKKILSLMAVAVIAVAMVIAVAGCAASLESIEVTSAPDKTQYVEGQKFDPEGMKITAVYSNGEEEEVTDYTFAPAGELKTTDTEITITYEGKTVTQKITVSEKVVTSIEITAQPTKTAYNVGETFDAAGMKVVATYNDKSTGEITDYTIRPSRPLCVNDENVYITSGDVTLTVPVTVTKEDGVTYPAASVVYKARGGTEVGGQSANVNFTFYSDYTVKGLLESDMGSTVDNVIGNILSFNGVWDRNDDEFYVVLNDFTFDPSTLSGLAGFVPDDMKEAFEQIAAMDPIDIEGDMAEVSAKDDGTISFDLVITAMGLQAPFSCTGHGAPASIDVKAGEAIEAEFGDTSKLVSSSSSSSIKMLAANEKASNGYMLQYIAGLNSVWSMTLDSAAAKTGATITFYFAGSKGNIADYFELKVNGVKVDLTGELAGSTTFAGCTATVDLKAGENTIELTCIKKATIFKFDYLTVNADVTVLNPELGEL